MTLHKTVEFARKSLLGILLGGVAIILLILLFRLGVLIKDTLFPAKALPANHLFGTLPALGFPKNVTDTPFTYNVNTVSGGLPQFPDRLNIYPIKQPQPNLLNLNKAKSKVLSLDFKDENSKLVPETALDNINYEWQENAGLRRKITFNTVTFDFKLQSNYLSSLTILGAKELSDEEHAINTALSFLTSIDQLPKDVDKEKSTIQLLSIIDSALSPTTSLSKSQVIKVDLHQKDVAYDLNTGIPQSSGGFKVIKMSLPILYPNPPGSTMSFWIASGQSLPQVVAAKYVYKTADIKPGSEATYPVKTAAAAFEELKNGKAYIAAYFGTQNEIAINKIYLAYYLSESSQEYLMPIIVFEGENGFFAYVSAVKDEWVK